MVKRKSETLFKRALLKIPGAVNSPVRAWTAVADTPLFIASGAGAHLLDCDGNRFIDYVGSYGPTILGHAHPDVVAAICAAA